MIADEKLDQIVARLEFLEARLAEGAAVADLPALGREHAELKPVVAGIAHDGESIEQRSETAVELGDSRQMALALGGQLVAVAANGLGALAITKRRETRDFRVAHRDMRCTVGKRPHEAVAVGALAGHIAPPSPQQREIRFRHSVSGSLAGW